MQLFCVLLLRFVLDLSVWEMERILFFHFIHAACAAAGWLLETNCRHCNKLNNKSRFTPLGTKKALSLHGWNGATYAARSLARLPL